MRASGVLLPVFSLPSPHGIGCFSKEAYEWVDFLKLAGQQYWQILPLGPTSYGDSPYQSLSTYAGNPYFIDLEELVEAGFLTRKEVEACDCGKAARDIDYGKLYENRMPLLKLAYERSLEKPDPKFTAFWTENAWWLDDYGLFMAVKDIFGGNSWDQWAEDIRYRWDNAMWYYKTNYSKEIGFYVWLQYLFFTQWQKLKKYANDKGLKIIGDIPIYVAYDSADVWAHPEMFQLDQERKPAAVAGCPPDGFSADGQLWGNPLYRWDHHRNTGYDWWVTRISWCFRLYDVVRIDHFRGFDEYFSIPAKDKTAVNGHWEKGPGIELFQVIKARLGEKPIIAEDLGYVTDTVRRMVKESGYPNMKVLEFAFDSRDSSGAGDYLPHNYEHNCVAYTGTHDNETILGWLSSIKPEEVQMVRAYLNRPTESKQVLASELVRTTIASVADTCIIPIQDYLGLDNSARINFPSTLGTNWRWRLIKSDLTKALADSIRKQNIVYGRVMWEDLQEDEKPKDPEEEKETETEPKQKKDSSVKEEKD